MKERTGIRNTLIAAFLITITAEFIGPMTFNVMGTDITILSLIWAIFIGISISPHILGKVIPALKKMIGKAEIDKAPYLLSIALYPLGIMFGIYAGPKVGIVLQAGPALLLQELGNMSTMLIALPIGVALGLGRSALGGTFSLCRDTALGIIGDKYGLNSPEGIGTLGTYISGSIFGTLLFSILAPLGIYLGLHPYALAMASGMGSGSMMGAATASLVNTAPQLSEQILAYSATSGLLTSVTGVYVELFLSLPLANYYYGKVAPVIEKLKRKKTSPCLYEEVK